MIATISEKATASSRAIQTLLLTNITVDHELQSRTAMHMDEMAEFSRAIVDGAVFPPIDVFWDGKHYWLADGFHRHGAHARAGLKDIRAIVHDGSRQDAIVFSAAANQKFSIQRSPGDVRKAIEMLLAIDEWFRVSSARIAQHVGCSPMTISKVREAWCYEHQISLPKTFEAANGRDQPAIKVSRFTRKAAIPARGTAARFAVDQLPRPSGNMPDRYSLEWTYWFNLLSTRHGFKAVVEQGKAMQYPGLKVMHRNGHPALLVVPCDLAHAESLYGAVGKLVVARAMFCGLPRSIVVCYPDDVAERIRELAKQAGIELIAPEVFLKDVKGAGR